MVSKANKKKKKTSNLNQHCLNCGTELKGTYCHMCGQESQNTNSTVMEFLLEYLNNAFMWDPKLFHTLWMLISRPGFLTKEFLSGKIMPYVHPLKLNMFLLFVFITLFVIFAGKDSVNSSIYNITDNDNVRSVLQLNLKVNDNEYAERLKESPRDTVHLLASLYVAESFPKFIEKLETTEDSHGQGKDKWTAVVPHALIEDNILVACEDGYYSFSTESGKEEVQLIKAVWAQMMELATEYFPMIILFTAPLLSLSVRLVQRRNQRPHLHHFIFSLHYTAFLELLIIAIYILFLITSPSKNMLQDVTLLSSCAYLTIAFRRVYETRSWWKAIFKALFTHLVYSIICLTCVFVIFIIACIIVAQKTV